MAPTQITISDNSCGSGDHIWRVGYDDGTVLDQPTPGGSEYSTILPDSGTYEIQVDVNDKNSVTTSFHVDNFPLSGEAVSFFDDDGNIWTAVLEDPCTLPVLADQFSSQPCGGIDILSAANRICYVGQGDIRLRYPNGQSEQLAGVDNPNLSLIDIEIDNEKGEIYLAVNRGGGQLFITKVPADQLAGSIGQGYFSEEYFTFTDIEQIAFGQGGDMVYFTNSSSWVYFQETEFSSYPEQHTFGNDDAKTAVAYNRNSNVLYFASGYDDCLIIAVDPVTLEVLEEFHVSCSGDINSMDLDEESGVVYYSDDTNVWKHKLVADETSVPILENLNRTLDSNGLSGPAVKLPIRDLVYARYDQ